MSFYSWTRWDLNPGPPPCKGGDLPADLRALSRGLVWPTNLFLIGLTVFRFPINRHYNSTRLCAALGGDPAADSPTATLLRLNPTREAQIRTRQKACPHSDLTRMV